MLVVSAVTPSYEEYASYLKEACKRLGIKCVVYSIKPDYPGVVLEGKEVAKCPYKPTIIKKALGEYYTPVIWMDADAFPIKPLTIDWDFDIGVTMRRPEEWNDDPYFGNLNAGVVLVNSTMSARAWLDLWEIQVKKNSPPSDQRALITLVASPYKDAEIKKLTTDEWNFYYKDNPNENTKIMHAKAGNKDQLKSWFEKYGPKESENE